MTQWDDVIYEPENKPSADTACSDTLILDFPASKTETNKLLLWEVVTWLIHFMIKLLKNKITSKSLKSVPFVFLGHPVHL